MPPAADDRKSQQTSAAIQEIATSAGTARELTRLVARYELA